MNLLLLLLFNFYFLFTLTIYLRLFNFYFLLLFTFFVCCRPKDIFLFTLIKNFHLFVLFIVYILNVKFNFNIESQIQFQYPFTVINSLRIFVIDVNPSYIIGILDQDIKGLLFTIGGF